jgi:hypothetical protein
MAGSAVFQSRDMTANPERPIFWTVRYMSPENAVRKFGRALSGEAPAVARSTAASRASSSGARDPLSRR